MKKRADYQFSMALTTIEDKDKNIQIDKTQKKEKNQ